MINKILCKIGLHSWRIKTEFFPNFSAPIVTRMLTTRICIRCKKMETLQDFRFDKKTGEPMYDTSQEVVMKGLV